jgi:hypothetical protein
LPAQVPLAFELNPLIRHAVLQGLRPVVLTGRFLEELTGDGFLWLPGMKYTWNSKEGDIDILACCDQILVMAECKDLVEAGTGAPTWEQVFTQFQDLVEVAQACGAELVVLAVRAAAFPSDWDARVASILGGQLRALLLTGADLERGNLFDTRGVMRGVRFSLSRIMAQPPGVVRVPGED